MSDSEPESEQNWERKPQSPLSKLKTTLDMPKVYNEERVDLKICASSRETSPNPRLNF